MRKRLAYLLFLCLLFCHSPAGAQQFSFTRTNLFEENVRGFITCMAQDSKGYMWFTGTSLYRYDGYHVVTYKNDPLNPKSITPSRLEYIYIDHNDIIWLGTVGKGLDRFDPSTGIFTHYVNKAGDATSLSNNTVTVILEDTDGELWIGTHGGLNRFNKKTGKFTCFRTIPNDPSSLSNDQVRALYQDKKGRIWVGCGSPYNNETPPGEGGLNRFDKATGKFTRYLHDPKDPGTLLDNKVRAIFEDSRGNFWVGTFGDGLHLMNRDKGTFRRYTFDPAHPETLSSPVVKGNYYGVSFITEDRNGGLWIGAFLAGLNYFDPNTSKVTRFKAETDNSKALGENTVWAATFSKEGVLWITTQGNVYRTDPLRRSIVHTPTAGRVHSFHEDAAGILWMASDSGLIRNDRKDGTFQYFVHDQKDPASISSNLVQSVYEDRKGMLWVGTDNGLNLFNRETNEFTSYRYNPTKEQGISNGGVFSTLEDRDGSFWVATDGGLNRMDRQTGVFTHYKHSPDSNSIGSDAVYRIFQDRSGNIWAGTWSGGGLNLLNKKTGQFKHYLRGSNIVEIYQDLDGVIWVGTQFGLYRKSPDTDEFVNFVDPASEIGTANIVGIIEDERKNFWIGSQSAIIKLNPPRNETSIYGRKFGVIPNSSYDLIAYKTANGELLFGDGSGYYSLFPEELKRNALPPQLQITDFKIADVSLEPGHAPLTTSIDQMDKITLDYKQGIFSIDFAGMHYSSIGENRHYYMLDNYDKKWRRAGIEKTAGYFNVPPGKYVFRVRASSSDGIWAEKQLTIVITPPWWFTWWAYVFYAIALTAIIWAIIYYRSRQLLKEKRVLWDQVKLRTAEIVKQKHEISMQRDNLEHALDELKATQAQLIQREKMASLGELTAGVAHEIQNPLNFVNNFSEVNTELVEELKTELAEGNTREAISIANDIKDNVERIAYHGKRADAIVKGMLQHSRKNIGLQEPVAINALADEYLRLSYHGLRAKDKSFNAKMITDFDDSIGKINIVPQDMGRVFLNLFNNAFYAVNEKSKRSRAGNETIRYEPTVSVSTKKFMSPLSGSGIEVIVKDNGIGIPQQVLDKIYQPFFTTKPSGEGTGLGLSLSYDIIKAHGGDIKVDTREGEGTEFIVQLPIV